MSTDTPKEVSRLLAAIDEVERPELDARGDHELLWTMGDTADTWHVGCHHCDWTAEGPEWVINPLGDQHARECVSMPISPVLRLCQAHRDILGLWQKAVDDYTDAAVYENGMQATFAAERVKQATWMVEALARGYRLEEG